MAEKKLTYYERNKDRVKLYVKSRTAEKKEYDETYQQTNKDKRKAYLEANKEQIAQKKKVYNEANKDKLLQKQKEWRETNKDRIRNNQKEKYYSNPIFKLKTNVKNLIGNSFRNSNFKKMSKTEQILGCSFQDFKLYLESKFEPWMNWNNRGLYNGKEQYGWDIDHIIPLSTAKNEFDIIKLNYYSNLQPLCSKINRDIKRNDFNYS